MNSVKIKKGGAIYIDGRQVKHVRVLEDGLSVTVRKRPLQFEVIKWRQLLNLVFQQIDSNRLENLLGETVSSQTKLARSN